MGKDKLKRFAEVATFENVLEPTLEELQRDFKLKGRWRETFFQNKEAITLELGCGKGEYTVELGRMFDSNFIGVDIKGARIWRGAKTALEENLSNVAFVRTQIEFLSYVFAPDEVDEIWLTFPDPQMKKDRKRLTGSMFLKHYQSYLKPDGIIHLKTDSQFLFSYTKAIVAHNNMELLSCIEDVYQEEKENPLLQIKTFYESQFLAKGIPSKYISFKLPHRELEEPEVEIPHDEYRSFNRKKRS